MYATVDDYMKRFDAPADMERLEAKLSDASLAVAAALRADGIDPEDPPAHIQDALVLVTCSVANRIMPLGSDITPGASSSMTTAGPYMSQQTFAIRHPQAAAERAFPARHRRQRGSHAAPEGEAAGQVLPVEAIL